MNIEEIIKEENERVRFMVKEGLEILKDLKSEYNMEDGLAVVNTAVQGIIPALVGRGEEATEVAVKLIEKLCYKYRHSFRGYPCITWLNNMDLVEYAWWLDHHKEIMAAFIDEA